MKKDFDFDDIGKRTPYRTPDGFFEDVQRKVMERTGVKQQRKSHMKLIVSTVIALAAMLTGLLFVPSLHQTDETNHLRMYWLPTGAMVQMRTNGLRNYRMRSWKSSSASLKTIYF